MGVGERRNWWLYDDGVRARYKYHPAPVTGRRPVESASAKIFRPGTTSKNGRSFQMARQPISGYWSGLTKEKQLVEDDIWNGNTAGRRHQQDVFRHLILVGIHHACRGLLVKTTGAGRSGQYQPFLHCHLLVLAMHISVTFVRFP
ncbi:hypothetical protein F4604DRAFT_1681344 [Suillus subluteus]|nr:hypothetical protein F4604DRAFT_1681344 [Suillus subluteus]